MTNFFLFGILARIGTGGAVEFECMPITPPPRPSGDTRATPTPGAGPSCSPAASQSHPRCLTGPSPLPAQRAALRATPGLPPLTGAAPLTDRRRVVTRDAGGRLQLWDLAQGGQGLLGTRDNSMHAWGGRLQLWDLAQGGSTPWTGVAAVIWPAGGEGG